jgi:indolepyruvate ferredoxin oxidoreductase, beta subunit
MDVIVAGVGGQGVLSASVLIAEASLRQGLSVKTVETRGMAQRGGPVCAHVRMSDAVVRSAVIPVGQADVILAIEPAEGVRYLHCLRQGGVVLANAEPFADMIDASQTSQILALLQKAERCVLLDASTSAKKFGSPRSANLVMLGAAARVLPVDVKHFEAALRDRFESKGDSVIAPIVSAFQAGYDIACALAP